MSKFLVRKAAVLGAGVMGAQIAAHLANAGVQPILFELAAEGRDKNANVRKALEGLAKLEPSPLATKGVLERITPANYDEHLALLARMRPRDRGDQRAHGLEEGALRQGGAAPRARTRSSPPTPRGFRSPSSRRCCPRPLRPRFCGIHFFNPPRYMRLVEIIPTAATDPAIVDDLEAFLTTTLGKGVVRAKDTPNFVANRVGVFSMLATMHHTLAFGLGFDEVDALTGPGHRARQERHLPHRRRGGPRHDGARREDDARHASRRPVASALQGPRMALRPHREGRARARRPRPASS